MNECVSQLALLYLELLVTLFQSREKSERDDDRLKSWLKL